MANARLRTHRRIVPWLPVLALSLLAAGDPLFVWGALRDPLALSRLAACFWLSGLAVAAIACLKTWSLSAIRIPAIAAGIFILVACLSSGLGADPRGSVLGEYHRYQGLVPLLLYMLMLLAASIATQRSEHRSTLLLGITAGGTLAAGYGVLQRLGLDWVNWTNRDPARIGGPFGQPNVFGVELAVALFPAVALWSAAKGWHRDALAICIALIVAALLFTLSRGAWLGAIAGAALLVAGQARGTALLRSTAIAAAGAAGLVALAAFVPAGNSSISTLLDRAKSSINPHEAANAERLGLWRSGLEMSLDDPIIGTGPDTFSARFAAYRTIDQPGILTRNVRPESSHSLAIDQAVGVGALGSAALAILIVSTIIIAWRRAPPSGKRDVHCVSAAIVAYYVATAFSFGESMTGWLPWLLLGTLLGVASSEPRRADAPTWELSGVTRVSLLLFGTAATAIGVVLVVADLQAGRGARSASDGHLQNAIVRASSAEHVNPFQRQYIVDRARYEEQAAGANDQQGLKDALTSYRRLNRRFARTAFGVLSEATVQSRVLAPNEPAHRREVSALLAEAGRLDPYNAAMVARIADVYRYIGDELLGANARVYAEMLQLAAQCSPDQAEVGC